MQTTVLAATGEPDAVTGGDADDPEGVERQRVDRHDRWVVFAQQGDESSAVRRDAGTHRAPHRGHAAAEIKLLPVHRVPPEGR